MTKGQFGPRDFHKQLWKLPIPEFDPMQELHAAIAEAGATAAAAAGNEQEELRGLRGDGRTVAVARRELRTWLRTSPEGSAVESAVGRLLAGE